MGQTRGRRREKKEKKSAASELDADFIPLEPVEESEQASSEPIRDNRSSFFGLLDRSELEYFKNAENILATNSLALEERAPFIASVFAEAKGKELKLATNQVCSKLFERLVQLADEEQIQQLMQAVEPFAVDLAYQKFSSHCLEAVFTKAVPLESCETLVCSTARRLGAASSDLASTKYSSHVLTTVILSLSGLNESMRSKKSQLARKHTEIDEEDNKESGTVEHNAGQPSGTPGTTSGPCRSAARDIVSRMISMLDTVEARKLALDAVTSPVIQALVMCEAALMSSFKLAEQLVLGDDVKGFISHCLTDPVGSHFLETVIKTLPAKKATKLVDSLPLAKLGASDNETSAYLVQAIIAQSNIPKQRKIEILHNELRGALGTNVHVSVAALDVDFHESAKQITNSIEVDLRDTKKSALFERLSKYGPFVEKAVDSLVAMDDRDIGKMGVDATESYILQSLLHASAPLIARRKLLNKLVIHIPQFTVNAFGSHIVDSLWNCCYKLKFARERIANELLKMEEQAKHSPYGRKVWKNWHMEKYARKRFEWWQIVKSEEDALRSKIEPESQADKKQTSSSANLPSSSAPSMKKRKVPNARAA